MKKFNLLLISIVIFAGISLHDARAQVIWQEDFDTYVTDSILEPQSNQWVGWGNVVTSSLVSGDSSYSGTNSMKIWDGNPTGATASVSDVLHLFGDSTSGRYLLSFKVLVPSDDGNGGQAGTYWNLQHIVDNNNTGQEWGFEVYLGPDGGSSVSIAGVDYPIPERLDSWVDVNHVFDLDRDMHHFFYDGVWITSQPFSAQSNTTIAGTNQLAGLDVFASCSNGCTELGYFDDFVFKHHDDPYNDAGIISTNIPTYCGDSADISVELKNWGFNNLTSVDINWELGGVAQPTYSFSGTLTPDSSTNVNLGKFLLSGTPPYDVKFWVDSANGVADTVNYNDTLKTQIGGAALSGTYTVDPSQSASATNFTSVGDMVSALNLSGVCGPTTIDIASGTYNASINLSNISGLSATNTLTIDGGDSSQTKITQNGLSFATLTFDGVQHVTVKNLTIENSGTSGDAIIFANGADYNHVTNCVSRVDANSTSFSLWNISFSGSATSNSTAANTNYNVVENNRIIGGYYGIRLYGSTSNLNVHNQIVNNEVDSFYYYGVYGFYQDSLDVIENSINGLNRGNQYSRAITVYYSNNTHIKKNQAWAGGYGTYLYNYNTYAPNTRGYEVVNNMVYSETYYGVYMYYVDSAKFLHNSVHTIGSYPAAQINASSFNTISGYDIRNNIFSAESSEAFATNHPAFYTAFDNNIFNTGGSILIEDDAGTYASLAAYQSSVTSWNINSLEGDPEFVSNKDLHIIGLLPNDMGDPTTGVSEDIDGESRPASGATSVDIGADEFTPPDLDASIVDMPNPGIPFCEGTFLVSAEINNLGLDTINSLTIYWVLDSVLDSVQYSGAIPRGGSDIVDLDSMTFSNGVPVDLIIYSSAPNGGTDGRISNDTLDLRGLQPALSGNYTVDSSQAASLTNFQSIRDMATALSAYGVCGPTTVDVASGTYNDYLYLNDVPGLSATNTLTIDGGDSSQTILTQNGQSFATLTFDGVEYVTVKNMTIENSGTSGDAIIFANGANYNQVTNCVSRVDANSTSFSLWNISFSGSATSNSTSAEANHNLIANNRIIGGYYSIRLYGSSTGLNSHNQIIENEVDSFYYYGVYGFYQDSLDIIGNSINGLSRGNQYSRAITVYYSNNTHIKKNQAWAGGYGAYLYNYSTYSPNTRGYEVVNNMVYSETYYGVYMYYVDSVDFWYNSVHTIGTNPAVQINASSFQPISDYDIRNNIFSSENSTSFATNVSGFITDFDYNIFYNASGGTIIADPSNSYTDLSSYVTTNPTYNVNSLQGDPEFSSQTDLHIFGILPNDKGDGSVSVYEDIDGDTRPSANGLGVDIGADEFDPPDLDAALTSMFSPSLPFCAGSYLASAVITNSGMDTLTTVKVYWVLDGVLDSTVYNGSILTGDTGIVTLDSVTFTNGVAYDLKVYTSDPNNSIDERNSNDTLEFEGLRTALSGTYTVDTSQATAGTNFKSLADLSQALTEFGVCGPTYISVDTGVYNEPLYLSDIEGLSSTNYLTIDGGDSSKTILSQSTQFATLTFDGVSNVMVKNMTIEKTTTSGDAIIFVDAQHDTVSNCVSRVPISSSFSSWNTSFSSSATSNSTGGLNDYNVLSNNRMIGGYYSIRLYGSSGSLNSYNQILNNEIDSAYYYGIYSYYGDSLEVVGNHINMTNTSNTFSYGMRISYDNNARISANYVTAAGYGAYLYNYNTYAPNTRRYEISNNMFVTDGNYGLYMYYVDSVDMFHNSINNYGTGQGVYIGASTTIEISGYDVRNNIFNASSASAFTTTVPDSIFMKFDYNIFNSGSTVLDIDGTAYTSLASYQQAQSLFNASSLEGNPQFDSNEDLHIVGSFPNDVGDPSVGITVDIDGDARPRPGANGVDIGADEFDPPTCPQPINLGYTNATLDSVTIFWDGNNSPGDYEIELVACGDGQGTGSMSVVLSDSSRIGGLNDSTCYDLYVREACSRGDTSLWSGPLSFSTASIGSISGSDTICMGDTVELSTSGTCPTLQWQVLDSNNNWVDISGATNASISVHPDTIATYRVIECDSTPSRNVFSVTPITVTAPTVINNQVRVACNSWGTDTLIASSTFPGSNYIWYEDSVGDAEVHRGDTLLFTDSVWSGNPAIDTFYVSAAYGAGGGGNVGPVDNTIGTSANYTAMNHYLEFTVNSPTVIKSVDVFANNAGLVDVVIQDAATQSTLFTHTVSVPSGGKQTLVLDQPIQPGDYRMGGTTTNNAGGLQRNSSGASYPYVSQDGSVEITGNTFSASYYYFFYNWEIGGGCESERVQVVGEIDCLVGMDEVSSIEGFNIYPNPSNGLFTMNLNTKQAENFNLIVRDVQGKLIYEEGISVNGAYRKDIDLSGLAKGVYYLHIQNDVTSKVEKLIIQ